MMQSQHFKKPVLPTAINLVAEKKRMLSVSKECGAPLNPPIPCPYPKKSRTEVHSFSRTIGHPLSKKKSEPSGRWGSAKNVTAKANNIESGQLTENRNRDNNKNIKPHHRKGAMSSSSAASLKNNTADQFEKMICENIPFSDTTRKEAIQIDSFTPSQIKRILSYSNYNHR